MELTIKSVQCVSLCLLSDGMMRPLVLQPPYLWFTTATVWRWIFNLFVWMKGSGVLFEFTRQLGDIYSRKSSDDERFLVCDELNVHIYEETQREKLTQSIHSATVTDLWPAGCHWSPMMRLCVSQQPLPTSHIHTHLIHIKYKRLQSLELWRGKQFSSWRTTHFYH